MEDWQQRVIEEAEQLEGKIHKLQNFIQMRAFEGLPEEEQNLLQNQLRHMIAYRHTLAYRIDGFGHSQKKTTLDKELEREDGLPESESVFGVYELKPVESLTVMLNKHKKDISAEVNYIIVDFDTCLGITNHICRTRDLGKLGFPNLEFADVFKFVEIQMRHSGE